MPWALLLNRYVIGAALLIASHAFAYHKGYSAADQRAKVAELQAALNAAHQDLGAQRIAAEYARRAAEENRQAADEAEKRIADYEAELKARGDADRCLADERDVDWMRHGPRSGRPKPPAK